MAKTREAGAELLLVINGSPYERNKDDTRLGPRGPPGGARPAARWPTSTWSAARTSWSSTATRWSSTSDGVVLARGPQFVEDLLVVDLDLAAATVDPVDPPEGVVHVIVSTDAARAVRRRCPPRMYPRLDPVEEVYARAADSAWATTCARTASATVLLGVSGGIDSALVATIAADALGGENVVGDLAYPSSYSSRAQPRTTPPSWPSASALDYRVQPDRADGRARSSRRSGSPASPRRTSRRASGA